MSPAGSGTSMYGGRDVGLVRLTLVWIYVLLVCVPLLIFSLAALVWTTYWMGVLALEFT